MLDLLTRLAALVAPLPAFTAPFAALCREPGPRGFPAIKVPGMSVIVADAPSCLFQIAVAMLRAFAAAERIFLAERGSWGACDSFLECPHALTGGLAVLAMFPAFVRGRGVVCALGSDWFRWF